MTFDGRESGVATGRPYELYLFQTQDKSWRCTSADSEKIHEGGLYSPATISRTNTTASSEVKGGHIKVSISKNHAIAQLFVGFIPNTPMSLVIYRNHIGEAESETKVAFTGRVLAGRFTTDDTCELDCAPDTEVLKRPIATTCFQRPCNRVLFDAGCGLSNAFWSVAGRVSAISADGLALTVAEAGAKANDWFSLGHIEKGLDRRMVISHVGSTITLINPMHGLKAGDMINIYAGCDRTYSGPNGCVAKFDNGVNFMGWEWIPAKNPFSSGLE